MFSPPSSSASPALTHTDSPGILESDLADSYIYYRVSGRNNLYFVPERTSHSYPYRLLAAHPKVPPTPPPLVIYHARLPAILLRFTLALLACLDALPAHITRSTTTHIVLLLHLHEPPLRLIHPLNLITVYTVLGSRARFDDNILSLYNDFFIVAPCLHFLLCVPLRPSVILPTLPKYHSHKTWRR